MYFIIKEEEESKGNEAFTYGGVDNCLEIASKNISVIVELLSYIPAVHSLWTAATSCELAKHCLLTCKLVMNYVQDYIFESVDKQNQG